MKVAILDAGAQYSKLIDGTIRKLGVESVLLPINSTLQTIEGLGCGAIVISGGPGSVGEESSPKCVEEIFGGRLPVLGICYGIQLINQYFGGSVEAKSYREDGVFEITVDSSSELFEGLAPKQNVLLTHGDSLGTLASSLKIIARSEGVVAGVSYEDRKIYGVQFHPEVNETTCGSAIFSNFLFKICKLIPRLNLTDSLENIKRKISDKVGAHHVIVFTSGGVDSTVCACLLKDLVGPDKVHCLFLDNGFMRLGEVEEIVLRLEKLGIKLEVKKVGDRFLNSTTTINGKETGPLHLITDPEQKRKIIGDTFRHVFEDFLREEGLIHCDYLLCQGTLRPDLIESASHEVSFAADTIKTHHNDSEAIRKLRAEGLVVEPLSELHKHEVVELAEILNIPSCTSRRQPFPGPGLSIRVICAEEPYFCSGQDIDMIKLLLNFCSIPETSTCSQYLTVKEFLSPNSLKLLNDHSKTEIFPCILPIRSVGVQGDGRSYKNPLVLQIRSFVEIPWDGLVFFSKLIPKLCHGINRVALLLDTIPIPSKVDKVTPTHLTTPILDKLRYCDSEVTQIMNKRHLLKNISQCPVVLIPIDFDNLDVPERHSLVIRPFVTRDFMTGSAAIPPVIPFDALLEMADRIKNVNGVSRVLFDLTNKPPGTTEWE